ncbi:MAG: HD-GYP domain-containing protein [Lachnospiraceae bacterium]|nr:HD-GYP domain-containing protein [Lachnospiraceae bacterium]
MKHVRIDVLVPGMVTAEDVFANGNQLILPQGLTLTDKAIKRLESYDIRSIRIEDPIGIEVEEIPDEEAALETAGGEVSLATSAEDLLAMLSAFEPVEEEKPAEEPAPAPTPAITVTQQEEPSHFEKIQQSPEFKKFKEDFGNNVEVLEGQLNDIVNKNSPIEVNEMLGPTMDLLSSQKSTFGVFDMLHNMRQFDDLTFAHSMNVSLICNVFAQWLGFSKDEQELATACGMLHDIGKLKISDSIIKKPGKLTEEEFKMIKAHPVEGYKILQHQNISEHIKNSALMHHEKCDGSGYPLRVKADKIDPYAKLVAIADVYDAMTSARVYRGAMCPFTVIKVFEDEGLNKYDAVYIMTFLENVVNTYIDSRVLLSDGRKATVKWIDKNKLSKPMVQLMDGSFVELSKEPNLHINKIL